MSHVRVNLSARSPASHLHSMHLFLAYTALMGTATLSKWHHRPIR